jgi:hypothetical protein
VVKTKIESNSIDIRMSNKVIISLTTANKIAEYVKNKMKASKGSVIEFSDAPVSYRTTNGLVNGKITEANLIDKTFKVSYLDNNDWQSPISINMNEISINKTSAQQGGGVSKDESNEETSLEFELNTDLELP